MRRLLSRDFMLLVEVGLNISCRTSRAHTATSGGER
jgi:hypothetical protein